MIACFWLLQANQPLKDIDAINLGMLDYLKLMLVLGLILALAFFVLRVALPRIAGPNNHTTGAIQVATRYPLEPKKNLYVVRVGEGYFLVGTTESEMHLKTLERSDIEAALAQTDTTPQPRFATLMQAFRRPKGSS